MKKFPVLIAILLLLTIAGCGSTSNNSYDESWIMGGNLHRSTISEWKDASYSNRLATSADMVVAYLDIRDFSDMDDIKQKAEDLEKCISSASENKSSDSEKVTFFASMCLVTLFPK